jgi:hypothetical protein
MGGLDIGWGLRGAPVAGFVEKHLEHRHLERRGPSLFDGTVHLHFYTTATRRYEVGTWPGSIFHISHFTFESLSHSRNRQVSSTTFGIQQTAWVTIPSTEGRHRGRDLWNRGAPSLKGKKKPTHETRGAHCDIRPTATTGRPWVRKKQGEERFSETIHGRSVITVPRHGCYYDLHGQRGPRNALPQSMSCRRPWLRAIQPSIITSAEQSPSNDPSPPSTW